MPAFWTGLSGTESRWSHWLVAEQVVSCTNVLPYKAEIIGTSNRPLRVENPPKKGFYLSLDTGLINWHSHSYNFDKLPNKLNNLRKPNCLNHEPYYWHRRRKLSRKSRNVRLWKRLHWDDVIFCKKWNVFIWNGTVLLSFLYNWRLSTEQSFFVNRPFPVDNPVGLQ